jgi:phage-related protein
MAKNDIGPKIGVDGEKEFKQQINEINNSLKTLGTEMKVVTSEFANNEKSSKSLGKQNEVLRKQTSELSDKLKIQNQQLQNALKMYGEDSAQVQYYQQEVNKTQAALNKANAEIERNNDLLSEKRTAVLKGIATGLTAMATAAAAAATALAKMTLDSGKWADDLNTLSKQTGISTEDLQKYQYAASRIDVSVETLTGSMSKLTKNMANARKGTGDAADAFDTLGVNVTNADGSLRDNEDVFKDTIAALGNIENETERDAMAMAIFGKSAQDLNPLILGGADALEQLGQEAANAGLILDQQSIDKLNGVQDAVDGLKATAEGAAHLFSVGFAGPIGDAINTVTGYIQQLTGSFDGGFSAMGETIGAILGDLTGKITEMLPEMIDLGMQIVLTLVESLVEQLPQIVETGLVIITTLVNSLAEALPDLIPVAVEAVLTIVETLIDNVDLLIDSAIAIITALANAVIESLPILIQKAPEIVIKLVNAIIENAPKLLLAAWELIRTIANGVLDKMQDIWEVGKNVVEGIIEGITNSFDWAWRKIKEWFGNVLQRVKDFLGIHSPSTVFAKLGKNMAAGVGVGWNNEFGSVAKGINNSFGSIQPGSMANAGVRASMQPATNAGLAASVNAIGSLMGGGNSGNLTIEFVMNGKEFSRAILQDFRMISAQSPIIVNDF